MLLSSCLVVSFPWCSLLLSFSPSFSVSSQPCLHVHLPVSPVMSLPVSLALSLCLLLLAFLSLSPVVFPRCTTNPAKSKTVCFASESASMYLVVDPVNKVKQNRIFGFLQGSTITSCDVTALVDNEISSTVNQTIHVFKPNPEPVQCVSGSAHDLPCFETVCKVAG